MIKAVVLTVNNMHEYCDAYYENDYYYVVLNRDDLFCAYLIETPGTIEISFTTYNYVVEVIRNKNNIEKFSKLLNLQLDDNNLLFKFKLIEE